MIVNVLLSFPRSAVLIYGYSGHLFLSLCVKNAGALFVRAGAFPYVLT